MSRRLTSILPLVTIVLVLVGVLAIDLAMTSQVNQTTTDIVTNAMTSIELVDEMRHLARRLQSDHPGSDKATTLVQFARVAERYAPLATYPGENQTWQHLKETLLWLQLDLANPADGRLGADLQSIDSDVKRLVEINRLGAESDVERIRELGRKERLVDTVAVILAIIMVSWIGAVRLRSLARERALVRENFSLIEERNRELDAFASRAAHDLRSPLNPIRGYAELIVLGEEPPEETRRLAAKIRTGVDRMVRVIEDMLELSRVGHPAPGRASLKEVYAEVVEELGPELRGATLSTAMSAESVRCSPGVMSQILRNLIGNAVKYRSPARPLAIEVGARAIDGYVVLDVVDNGLGMDPESAKHAFEPFFRACSEVAGHGIGLAIVDKAVKSQGGSCELSSNVGAGTRVTVRLPRAG